MCLEQKRQQSLARNPLLYLGFLPGAMAYASDATVEEGQRWGLNMTRGVTDMSNGIYDLHMLILNICIVIGILVFGVMFYSMYKHRKSRGFEPATFHENTTLEILWTAVPALILIAMAWPATKTLIAQYDKAEDADLTIMVTGYQWKWKYEYLDSGVSYFSSLRTSLDEINNVEEKGEHYLLEVDEPLVIPVNKKVRFLITANDVIHSWWVPAFAVKQDAIPGFINTAWTIVKEEGVFRGQCAELCGRDHGFMPIVVNAVDEAEFASWKSEREEQAAALADLIQKEMTVDQLMDEGKNVYQKSCVVCHGAAGEGGVGKALAGGAVPTGPLNDHLDVMVNGVPGTAMQAFGAQLNEIELAAVTTYVRNSWGNNMGDSIQPVDVYQFKQAK